MTSLLMIVLTAALINNVVLNQFLGLCSFLGVSKQTETAASLGGAVIFVITIASGVANLLFTFVLEPLELEYLQTIVFILVIAALVQVVEMFLKKSAPALHKALGIYLPLITTNCAVLGVALTNVTNEYGFFESILAGFGTAAGYTIAIVLMAGIRERVEDNEDIPECFKGAPIVLLIAALMAIAFAGFANLNV
jgi:electron transport complex protein RnfA